MRTKRMTMFLTLTLTIIFSFASYPFTWAGDSERTASISKSDSFHKDLSPNIGDKISQMPSSMERHEAGLSSAPAGALDSAPNIWSRVERVGVNGFFNQETADFKREGLRESLPRGRGSLGLPLPGTSEKGERIPGTVANLLNQSGKQPFSDDPTFGRSPARSSKESIREMRDSLMPQSTDPLSTEQGGIGRSGGTDSSDLFDIMKQGRQEERDRMRSTDPRAHMPEEAQDRLSPRANQVEHASMSASEERQLREETLPWIRGESNEVPSDDNQIDDPEDPSDDDDEKQASGTDSTTTPLPDDAGPLPSWAAPTARFLEGLEPTKINRADKRPWINPDPERSSEHLDPSLRRIDPITPVVNPNPDDQGSGGGGEGDRVVRGPGYGQIDPSPDDDEDDQPTPGNSGNS